MSTLHIANCSFESELAGKIRTSPLLRQLEFLPFLYGAPNDGVLTSTPPPKEYLDHLQKLGISHPQGKAPFDAVESWGFSLNVAAWARKHRCRYDMPPWDIVCEVNSKRFSYTHSSPLPHSTLLHHRKEAEDWLAKTPGKKVFKTCFGVSGTGHFFEDTDLFDALQKEWAQGRPVIAEPWVNRLYDFSTQWEIFRSGALEYLGETLCVNTDKGSYAGTRVGNFSIRHLEEHKTAARAILLKMAALGYFGNVGIDAFVYEGDILHPIVEINARKTLGWVALMLQKRHFPGKTFELSYVNADVPGLLPQIYKRQLILNFDTVTT